jgi:hypothetical protein
LFDWFGGIGVNGEDILVFNGLIGLELRVVVFFVNDLVLVQLLALANDLLDNLKLDLRVLD